METVGPLDHLTRLLARQPRQLFATLPTPMQPGPIIGESDIQLWVKRDDLTGLGMGGNKARKLEYLCGAALAVDADCLVTIGAAQSNHCRMTAAAGAVLGVETHLVLSGERPDELSGNLLLSDRFGAHLHFTGADAQHWGELAVAAEGLVEGLAAQGLSPFLIPIGGSTPIGALGYAAAYIEMSLQWRELEITPSAVVVTSSSGGTHAGLVAGRALMRNEGWPSPPVVAIGVAKGVIAGLPDVRKMAADVLHELDLDPGLVTDDDVEIHDRWLGDDYAVPTMDGDDAVRWAGAHAGLVLDRTYTGKGFAGLLGLIDEGRFASGRPVVWIHTGGMPAVFAPGGSPAAGARTV